MHITGKHAHHDVQIQTNNVECDTYIRGKRNITHTNRRRECVCAHEAQKLNTLQCCFNRTTKSEREKKNNNKNMQKIYNQIAVRIEH